MLPLKTTAKPWLRALLLWTMRRVSWRLVVAGSWLSRRAEMIAKGGEPWPR